MAATPGRPEGHGQAASSETERDRLAEAARLLRVGTMVHTLLDEARELSLDEHARDRLRHIHARAVEEVAQSVAPELRDELERLLPDSSGPATQAEIRILQAQLVGWLEGIFQSIQAGLAPPQGAFRESAGLSSTDQEEAP
ncbi:proteasome activator [Nonomuraea sp. M3C6]|uniref:Bacterial proteasome activator n=1 Tax=Nonomuraea marmarensis TaxID=3351344 RepID=A0ABW7AA88_9ACTN